MKTADFEKVPKVILVLRNSVDFDQEIIAYVPKTPALKNFIEVNYDIGTAPSSLPLLRPHVMSDALSFEPLVGWDPDGKVVCFASTMQMFYLMPPNAAAEAAFRAAVPEESLDLP